MTDPLQAYVERQHVPNCVPPVHPAAVPASADFPAQPAPGYSAQVPYSAYPIHPVQSAPQPYAAPAPYAQPAAYVAPANYAPPTEPFVSSNAVDDLLNPAVPLPPVPSVYAQPQAPAPEFAAPQAYAASVAAPVYAAPNQYAHVDPYAQPAPVTVGLAPDAPPVAAVPGSASAKPAKKRFHRTRRASERHERSRFAIFRPAPKPIGPRRTSRYSGWRFYLVLAIVASGLTHVATCLNMEYTVPILERLFGWTLSNDGLETSGSKPLVVVTTSEDPQEPKIDFDPVPDKPIPIQVAQVKPEPPPVPPEEKPPAPQTPPAEASKPQPEATPPTPPAPEPKAQPEKPAEANAAPKLEQLTPLNSPGVANNTHRDDPEPPKDPKYLGATNSEAADHGPRDLPKGDPFNANGKSAITRDIGERGESAKGDTDPNAGSITREGGQKIRNPIENKGQGVSGDLTKVHDAPVKQGESGAPEPKEGRAPDKPEGVANAKPTPEPALTPGPEVAVAPDKGKDPDPARRGNDDVRIGIGDKEGQTKQPLRVEPDLPKPNSGQVKAEKVEPKPKSGEADPRPVAVPATGTNRVTNPPSEGGPKPDKPKDNALAALEARLNQKPGTTGPDEASDASGLQQRKGEVGHEGDGRVRKGDLESVSDMPTFNLDSSAGKEGDTAFATVADPVVAYIQKFHRLTDAKWKAIIFADTRTRGEFGRITLSITLANNGQLAQIKLVERSADVSDKAVSWCVDAVRAAGEGGYAPFPPKLANRDRLTFAFTFVYFH